MLDLPLSQSNDGLNRRNFLRLGAAGAIGLTLPNLLRAEEAAGTKDDMSLIVMWMQGGPSHIDTFDPKPTAPIEIRGEFKTINTNVPGIELVEHMPNLAKNMDKFSIIRSGYNYNGSHGVADAYMLSGWKFTPAIAYPCYGSVVAHEFGYRRGMPPFVQVGLSIDRRFGAGVAGYLGQEFNAFEIDGDPSNANFSIEGLSMPSGVTAQRFARRQQLLDQLNTWQRKVEESADSVGAMESFYEKAFGMVTSPAAKAAFDLKLEKDKTRDTYGRNRFGQSCLLARRLVEAGVRVVTITDNGWDTHQGNFPALGRKVPILDQGMGALLSDLSSRGMLEKTIILWTGDFGRTPKVNSSAGRDHWVGSTSFCVAGGGFKGGMAFGRSDDFAEQPATDPVRIEDIATTIYQRMGVPTDKHFSTPDGRPVRVASDGRYLSELMST